MIFPATFLFTFIAIRFIIILVNFASKSRLVKSNKNDVPLISILVPARNEEDNILQLLDSVKFQNYKNYEMIILDDSSDDRTYEICSDFQMETGKLKIIKGKPLPSGWLGKNFACHQLAKEAKGKYLLFLDADVVIKEDLISSAIDRVNFRKLSLLSLFADQQTVTWGEKITVPLMYYLLLSLLPVRLIYSSENPAFGVASGQCMLFEADTYRKYQWHKAVQKEIVEDLAIMRTIKANGFKGESLMSNGLISCRMYRSYSEALKGFSKNFLAAFNNSIWLFAGFLLLLVSEPMVFLFSFNLLLCGVALGMIIIGRLIIGLITNRNVIYEIILHPLQVISLIVIFGRIIYERLNGYVQWKGRIIRTEV